MKWGLIFVLILVILISGCTEEQEQAFRQKYEPVIKQEIKESVKEAVQEVNQSDNIVCNAPYIRFADTCCLDANSNNICDNDETQQPANNNAPTVSITYPEDNSCTDEDQITFYYLATDDDLQNCSIYVDGNIEISAIVSGSYGALTSGQWHSLTSNIDQFDEGEHDWFAGCYDDSGNLGISETHRFDIGDCEDEDDENNDGDTDATIDRLIKACKAGNKGVCAVLKDKYNIDVEPEE